MRSIIAHVNVCQIEKDGEKDFATIALKNIYRCFIINDPKYYKI